MYTHIHTPINQSPDNALPINNSIDCFPSLKTKSNFIFLLETTFWGRMGTFDLPIHLCVRLIKRCLLVSAHSGILLITQKILHRVVATGHCQSLDIPIITRFTIEVYEFYIRGSRWRPKHSHIYTYIKSWYWPVDWILLYTAGHNALHILDFEWCHPLALGAGQYPPPTYVYKKCVTPILFLFTSPLISLSLSLPMKDKYPKH